MVESDRLSELHGVTRRLVSAGDEAEVLDAVIESVARAIGFSSTSVRRADRETGALSPVARSAGSQEVVGDLPQCELGDGSPAARAFESGESVLDEHGPGEANGRDPSITSLYVPVGDYGVISIGRRHGSFVEEDVELLETLADTAAAALRRTHRERAVRDLHAAAQRLTRAEDRDDVTTMAVDAARDLLDLSLTTVLLYDAESDLLRPVEHTDGVTALHDLPPVAPSEGIMGRAFEAGESENHTDVREDPAVLNPETEIRSELVVPFGRHGILVCDSQDVGAFDATDEQLAGILAANVEAALDRCEREAQLRERTREVERQNERLETFASVLSHDLRGPLNVAEGYLDLAREEYGDDENLARVATAHDRMGTLIADVLTLARQGRDVGDVGPVRLSEVARAAWGGIETEGATLTCSTDAVVHADEGRLRQLLENLFRNSVKHGLVATGAESLQVRVGSLSGASGFFVADDGPGIPADARERVFESGYTTGESGPGLGLQIVRTIADGHGWSVSVTEGDDGGACIEVSDVDVVDADD
jgi:signal transduction histidine kinase